LPDFVSPLAILVNARGDSPLNLPALRALAHLFPGRLKVFCRPGARRTFFPDLPLTAVELPTPVVDGRYTFDATMVAARAGPCDAVLSLNPWHGPDVDQLLELVEADHSIGYHPAFRTPLPLDFDKHNCDLAFDLPRAVDPSLRIEAFAGRPRLEEVSVRFAKTITSCLPEGVRVVVVHADTKQEKQWPIDRFCALLDWLLGRHPDIIVLDLGQEDLGLGGGRLRSRVIHCGMVPLSVALALVESAVLFIGIDSCFLHAPDLLRVPGVALFGPTHPAEFEFRFGPPRHAWRPGGMEAVTVASVIAAIEELEEDVGAFGPLTSVTASEGGVE